MGRLSRDNGYIVAEQELSFWGLLKNYLKDNELVSLSTIVLSVLLSIGLVLIISNSNESDKLFEFVLGGFLSATTDLMAILIAAFGLFAAITDLDFSRLIFRLGHLRNLLFPFWFCTFLWGINLISSIFVGALIKNSKVMLSPQSLVYVSTVLFMIALFYTVSLVGDIIKLTLYRVQLQGHEENLVGEVSIEESPLFPEYSRFLTFIIFCSGILVCIHAYLFIFNDVLAGVYYLAGALDLLWIIVIYKFNRILVIKEQQATRARFIIFIKILVLFLGLIASIYF